ncbi:MAG: hypothetical protein ACI9R3_003172 [Verrucomicrobiales bacterium]|jgi:hypothetical protein
MVFQEKAPARSRLRESLFGAGVIVCVLVKHFGDRARSWLLTIGLVTASGTLAGGEDAAAIRTIVTSEEQILALTPGLASLSKGLLNLQLPDAPRRELFAPTFDVVDLEGSSEAGWQPSSDRKSSAAESGQLWSSLLDEVAYFEHAKFAIVKGSFQDGNPKRFIADVDFSAVARMKAGHWRGLSAKLSVVWKNLPTSDDEDDWRIIDWHTGEFSSVASDQLWFQESLDEALPRPTDVVSLRRSQHHEETIKFYMEGRKGIPHRYFATISANQKPGIAIADIDSDGDDDVYVTVRRGYNKLLENQGDGTFRETANFHGLDVKNHSTCAIFADFDNDGDPDLMLGRSLLPCKYFENNGGWFSEMKSVVLPRLAISMSATDYNNDGLLDVYICTYRPAVLGGSSPTGGVASGSDNWPDEFLSPKVAKEYYQRHAKSHPKVQGNLFPNLLDQIGPPNVLLVNKGGGKFEPAPESAQIGIWRNSLQATWSDYDEDGDTDLYVANDWAPDHLFRNDGKDGFSDVTKVAGTTAFGFAMGATWGDYDNDGKQDLYVTNMFSKAGQRITAQVEGLNADYAESATGNYLYQQKENGTFDLVSGLKPPAMLVAKAGWGWGGQFADFNNDGWLDIYSINGYFTAPKEVATEVDL